MFNNIRNYYENIRLFDQIQEHYGIFLVILKNFRTF